MHSRNVVWRSTWGKFFSALTLLLVPLSLASVLLDYAPLGRTVFPLGGAGHPGRAVNILDIVIYGVWTVVPPAWFFLEYAWLFPDPAKVIAASMEDMKYTQELASKFWAGLLVLFSILLLLKYDLPLK